MSASLSSLSVRELRRMAAERGLLVDAGVVEKSDLVKLVEGNVASVPSSSSPIASTSSNSGHLPSTSSPLITMSVGDLRDLVRSLAGRTSQCTEKIELFELARSLLSGRSCGICLSGDLLGRFSERVVRVPCCGACMHADCEAGWIVTGDKFPPTCGVCGATLEERYLEKYIFADPIMLKKFNRYLDSHKELRAKGGRTSGSNVSAETAAQLSALNYRPCPSCGAWIEKGPAMEAFGMVMAEGCDKMTCRCGCQFCYRCGSIGARCACTGPEHGFFPHETVLRDYPDSHVGGRGDFFDDIQRLLH